MKQVAEGVRTTYAVCALAERLGVEMPIADAVARGARRASSAPRRPGQLLMTRQLRSESE